MSNIKRMLKFKHKGHKVENSVNLINVKKPTFYKVGFLEVSMVDKIIFEYQIEAP